MHTLTKTDKGYIIEVQTEDWLTVVWTIAVEPTDLLVRCHTVVRNGEPNEDGLAVLPVDAESVRLEAL
jgi:hypothetical protein